MYLLLSSQGIFRSKFVYTSLKVSPVPVQSTYLSIYTDLGLSYTHFKITSRYDIIIADYRGRAEFFAAVLQTIFSSEKGSVVHKKYIFLYKMRSWLETRNQTPLLLTYENNLVLDGRPPPDESWPA